MTPLADRYAGRHIRKAPPARHGAWLTKKRTRSRPAQVVPAAAAFTVAGVLIGGAGTVIQLGTPETNGPVDSPAYDAASYPIPDRGAAANRVSRTDPRLSAEAQAKAAEAALAKAAMENAINDKATAAARVTAQGSCEASYYDEGQRTASGETFDPSALTAASKTLPFGTQVRVTNEATGSSVVVRINDRGPYVSGRCLDLSEAAFSEISKLGVGVVDVHYEVLAQDAT